jgi:hypothetical protein
MGLTADRRSHRLRGAQPRGHRGVRPGLLRRRRDLRGEPGRPQAARLTVPHGASRSTTHGACGSSSARR